MDLNLYHLKNSHGTELSILNYGAAIFSLTMADKKGEMRNLIVAPKNPDDYLLPSYKIHNQCFGASVGRFAGRINKGKFTLNRKNYQLYEKNGVHLHGGEEGFQYKFWNLEEQNMGNNPSITFSYLSKDGEEGYPGNLRVKVTYTLTEQNKIIIEYEAFSDKETVLNLTNHAYFNLSGGGDITQHRLRIHAKNILETNDDLIPTGDFISLSQHPKNFYEKTTIGNINLDDVYVLIQDTQPAAELYSPDSGIKMKIKTNQKSIVAYALQALPTEWDYQTPISDMNSSICLETQNFPDAPNHPHFPSCILKPGEGHRNKTEFSFYVPLNGV